ncbi:Protein toc75-3, chloroplastic [Cymbomonas tetramitiformis]|uniref:Protein toc75-3, chloroplastic n=1 Tax=Cymbomonas tetramitiformis TaxID=36881 RepID=A0AAE0FQX0_9CHLO|nr:Protein toc75-3, chloroplastic [Cymbomonas tetramitiformis]
MALSSTLNADTSKLQRGGGDGGGGGGGNFGVQPAFAEADDEDEEEESEADADEGEDQKFLCEGVKAANLVAGPGIPTQAELFDGLNCQPGAMVSRKELSEDLTSLLSTGLFQNVDANVQPTGKGYVVEFTFREKVWPGMVEFKISGATVLPEDVADEVLAEARKSKYTTVRVLAQAKNIIEGYYQEKGLSFGTISHFDGMETGSVIAHVIEGEVASVNLVYLDDKGGQSNKGSTNPRVVRRELPFKVGELYNVEDAKRALRDIFVLQLFDNVQVVPKPNEEEQSKVDVDIVLKERPLKTAEVELEWGIAPGDKGRPDLVNIRPGGSVFFENRNLDGEGRQLYGSVSTSNFFSPNEDLGFKIEYVHPYVKGDHDENRTCLNVSAFNSRKLSPVFTGGPFADEVPPIWVDRAGAKATVTENFTRQSKLTYGLVLEEITTRDENGSVCTNGMRNSANGMPSMDGPPTTFSDSGTDRVAFLQANMTRDCTYFCNGTPIGARDIWQMDQGLGIGPGNPFYNRTSLSSTRFIMLKTPGRRSEMPPPVLVLHAKGGMAIGDLPSYDAFVLGGPYSVRGYNVGELAACRRLIETAIELRVPVPKLNSHAYSFYEYGTDLGSSKELAGNPTEFYRRMGKGASWGGGMKLGAVRAEYVHDGNTSKGNFFIRFGERF